MVTPAAAQEAPATARAADSVWKLSTAGALLVIWAGVVVISLLSPDLVSGSEQEHLPIAAFGTWLWGAAATGAVLVVMGKMRSDRQARSVWVGFSVVTSVIWLVATVLALTLPEFETGTDPTLIPLGAVFAPIAATVLTGLAGVVSVIFARPPGLGPE